MEIKFNKKIVKAINKWLKKYGFSTTCDMDKDEDMSYYSEEDMIILPAEYDNEPDRLFKKCLRGLGMKTNFDMTTLSILHELGHAQTLPLMTEEESDLCDGIKREYAVTIDEDSDDYHLEYWKVKDELMANKWAVMYADLFPEKVQALEDILLANAK